MNVVQFFMDEEKSKCNWLERLFNNYPVFYFAEDITVILKHKNIDKTFVVSPSKSRRFFAILLICLGLFGWFSVFLAAIQNILLPISIVALLLTTAWIGNVLSTFFISPKWSYKIFIDKDKIRLGKQTFGWENITEYLLMEKGGGRYLETNLVLFTEKEAFKFNLTNLNISGEEIIKRIEFYKQ